MITAKQAKYFYEEETPNNQLFSLEEIIKHSAALGLTEIAIPYIKRGHYDLFKPKLEENGFKVDPVYNDGIQVMFYIRW